MNECVCGGVESSSPCHGEGRGFESRQTRWNGTVRKLEKRRDQPTTCRSVPETFVILRVRLPPLPLDTCVGWALACPSGCNPPASAVQVQLLPDALEEGEDSARSSIGSGRQPLTLARRVQFPHGSLVMRCRRGWRPTGSHKAGRPVRFRGLQLTQTLTQVGQRPVKAHNLRLPGATPGPATSWPSTQTGKAARSRAW